MKFSQRKGFTTVNKLIQKDSISKELRNKLWNIIDVLVFHPPSLQFKSSYYLTDKINKLSTGIWHDYFKKTIDSRPYSINDIVSQIRKYFFSCEWYEVYDFLEYIISYENDEGINDSINEALVEELSAYRFIDNICTDIIDEQEVEMLEQALKNQDYPGVTKHLRRALELLSDKKNPDYRNSIKESISAVESLAKEVTNDRSASLGDALRIIEKNHKIHPALREGFSKLYGYTSNEEGIRHSMLEEPTLDIADAKYFLLSCTSFINYLKEKVM